MGVCWCEYVSLCGAKDESYCEGSCPVRFSGDGRCDFMGCGISWGLEGVFRGLMGRPESLARYFEVMGDVA